MANKKVNLIISLKDGVSSGLSKISGGFRSLGKTIFDFKKILLGMVAGGGALALFKKSIQESFNFETLRTQLKVLLGSTREAGKAFRELRDFSARTPFQLPGIIDAYQQLQTFTDGALSAKEGLELVGDAAAGRNKDFQEVAYWVGRLYSALKNGDPFMDSVSALQRLGIVGGTIRGDLERLTKAGASFGDKWVVVESQLQRFRGGMKELSETGNGLISTLKDNWTIALATFGDTFQKLAKDQIKTMISTLQRLVKDGSIEKWAEQAKTALNAVIETIKIIKEGGEGRSKILLSMANVIKAAFIDAATGAVALLAKHAPRIGEALGKAAKDAFKLVSQDRVTGEQRQQAREQTRARAEMMGIRQGGDEWHEMYNELVDEMKTLNRENRLREEGLKLEQSIKEFGGRTENAFNEFLANLEKYGSGGLEGKDLAEEFARTGRTDFWNGDIASAFKATGQTDFWKGKDLGAQRVAEKISAGAGVDVATQIKPPTLDMTRQIMPDAVKESVDSTGQSEIQTQSDTMKTMVMILEEQNKILNERLGGVTSS